MRKPKISKLLKYAFGEIILVTTGILIAVSLNNWNDDRKNRIAVDNSVELVLEELKNDTVNLNEVISLYERREKRFNYVLYDSVYTDSIECPECNLITGFRLYRMNKRGYERLSSYGDLDYVKRDSLLSEILQFYSMVDEMSPVIQESIHEDVIDVLKLWRDKYEWFDDVLAGKRPKDYIIYLKESSEYKNRVAYQHVLIYENYIPFLKMLRKSSENFISELEDLN